MKVIHTSTIVGLFRLLLLFWVAMPAKGQERASGGFVGEWCNKDFATRGNTRIHIRSEGAKLMVHRWGRCHPTECDCGETAATQGPTAKSILLTWEDGFATTTQELTLVADGILELSGHTHFTDQSGRADSDSKAIFVKGLVHDWRDNATGPRPLPGPMFLPANRRLRPQSRSQPRRYSTGATRVNIRMSGFVFARQSQRRP